MGDLASRGLAALWAPGRPFTVPWAGNLWELSATVPVKVTAPCWFRPVGPRPGGARRQGGWGWPSRCGGRGRLRPAEPGAGIVLGVLQELGPAALPGAGGKRRGADILASGLIGAGDRVYTRASIGHAPEPPLWGPTLPGVLAVATRRAAIRVCRFSGRSCPAEFRCRQPGRLEIGGWKAPSPAKPQHCPLPGATARRRQGGSPDDGQGATGPAHGRQRRATPHHFPFQTEAPEFRQRPFGCHSGRQPAHSTEDSEASSMTHCSIKQWVVILSGKRIGPGTALGFECRNCLQRRSSSSQTLITL